MAQRLILAIAAFALGTLCWQRTWIAAGAALAICAWLILDSHALDRLDTDYHESETHSR